MDAMNTLIVLRDPAVIAPEQGGVLWFRLYVIMFSLHLLIAGAHVYFNRSEQAKAQSPV